MTPEQKANYLARCQEIAAMTRHGYSNPELEAMMLQPDWKVIYKQHLTPSERKKVQSYSELIKDPSIGCLDSQIAGWDALVESIKKIQKKLSKPKK